MKAEAWIFGDDDGVLPGRQPRVLASSSGDWTGTSALVMTTLLAAMVTLYLGFHAAKMEPARRTARTARSPTEPASWASSRRTRGGRCGAP